MAAPKTVATYDLNGSTREFDFAFDYLARSFVKVSLIGTERAVLQVGTDYTFVSANRIRTNVIYGAPDYQQIEIRRETSTTDRLVDFQDASILRADDLDLSQLQVLHVAEEAREAATETLGVNNFGHVDARGRRIVNVADPVDLGDAVTKRWYAADVNGVYQNRVASEQARDTAREWATSPNQVEPGLESSKTYAARAKASEAAAMESSTASANSAESSSASAMAASASAGSALNRAVAAEGHANAASVSASSASSSASDASSSAASSLTQANRAKDEADRAETNATLVDTAFLRNRANHIGKQPPSTVTGLAEYLSTPSGFRNKIINGKMEIAQRGASFAAAVANNYTLDRWLYAASTDAVVTISQQADVPSSNEFQYSLRVAVTTADAAIAAAQNATISHRVEGYNARDLIGRTFIISFFVRSSKTGTHCLGLRNGPADRSYITEYAVNVANTWEQKSIAVPAGLITAGTWNWTNGAGLMLDWVMACGPNFRTTAGAWNTGNFLATANQVNCLDTVGNIFAITGVQLEVGEVATPFEHRPYGAELALCQRYYETGSFYFRGYDLAGGSAGAMRGFSVTKRTAPTMSLTPFAYLNASGANTTNITTDSVGLYATVTATGSAQGYINWTATAEL